VSRLMAHMVPYFPDRERSLAVAEGLIAGGATFLEIQFPFSDPTADGPVIQAACQQALENGFSVDDGFRFVSQVVAVARASGREVPVFIMSYASLVAARGPRRFLADGKDAGAAGFILPDLPIDYDEGVYEAARDIGTSIVPVIVTTADSERVARLLAAKPEYVYVALRRGITGSRTEVGEENTRFLNEIAPSGARILAGFGISDRAQVEQLEPHVFAVIVGTALVREVTEHAAGSSEELRAALESAVRRLCEPG